MVSTGAQSSETTVETYYVVMTINKTQTHVLAANYSATTTEMGSDAVSDACWYYQ